MDNKKLAKLIDRIVEMRLKKILKSQALQQIIKEQVSKEVIKLLVEVNLSPNKQTTVRTAKKVGRTPNLLDVLGEKKNAGYPRLPTITQTGQPERKFTKNPSLNKILNQTAKDKVGMSRLNSSGNPLVDMGGLGNMGGQVDLSALSTENPGLITSELSRMGIDPNKIANMGEFDGGVDVPVDLTNEDMLSEGLDNVDISELAQDEKYGHLVNALTRDYSDVLNLVDEKVKARRPVQISTLSPGIPATI